MGQHALQGIQGLPDPFDAAGQVDNEGLAAHADQGTRESRSGVFLIPSDRINWASPGTSLSMTQAVASGVTSLGARPVPPVVTTSSAL